MWFLEYLVHSIRPVSFFSSFRNSRSSWMVNHVYLIAYQGKVTTKFLQELFMKLNLWWRIYRSYSIHLKKLYFSMLHLAHFHFTFIKTAPRKLNIIPISIINRIRLRLTYHITRQTDNTKLCKFSKIWLFFSLNITLWLLWYMKPDFVPIAPFVGYKS